MAAVAWFGPGRPSTRRPLRVVFTVDEEVGHGTDHFDLGLVGADVGYTLDGSGLGEIEVESFSAYQARVTIRRRRGAPWLGQGQDGQRGQAGGRPRRVAARRRALAGDDRGPARGSCIRRASRAMPPTRPCGSSCATTTTPGSRSTLTLLRRLVDDLRTQEPRSRIELEVQEQYRNMGPALDEHPDVVSMAEEAIRRVGVEPVHTIIRGGTDGARLTEQGLPTPNIFTGGQLYHSRARVGVVAGHGRRRGDGGRARAALGRAPRLVTRPHRSLRRRGEASLAPTSLPAMSRRWLCPRSGLGAVRC